MLDPEVLLGACKQSRYQGSGPGGQKRNRVYSGIRLVHGESGLAIECEAHRESHRNLEVALQNLRFTLALAMQLEISDPNSLAEVENDKAFREPVFRADASPRHFDFPIFMMRALYWFSKHHGHTAATAQVLGCSTSALIRFLKADKCLWMKAKEIRERHGLHPLK